MKPIGLIYCRVSSRSQVSDGNGLSSQEKRCRDYASNILGVDIEKVFYEEGISGGIFERKSIQEVFKYIDENKKKNYIVIFEDLNRLSRDIQVHGLLKNEFKKRGVELASPNFQFDESPEGLFKENISVVVSEYERRKNAQRVSHRMKARLEQGFWCFPLPIGYKYFDNPNGGGKVVMKDESCWKIVKEGFEMYAHNSLETINDLIRFFQDSGLQVGTMNGRVVYNQNLVARALRNSLYAGYVEYPKWDISRRVGQHDAIISTKIFEKIQNKLSNKSKGKKREMEINLTRKDRSADFPLRGFLFCQSSGYLLSGAWTRGKTSTFPYYIFPRNSPMRGKSIPRKSLHDEFERYLENIAPKPELIDLFSEILFQKLKDRKSSILEYTSKQEREIEDIEKKIHLYIQRIGETSSSSIIKNYEKEVEKLEQEKDQILEKIEKSKIGLKNVRTPINEKLKMFRKTLQIWKSGDLETKKFLLRNIFPEGIPIDENRHVRTPILSLVYQAFQVGKDGEN